MKNIIMILMLLVSTSCIMHTSAPKESSDFSQVTSIHQFKGIYKNAGDPKGYLSQIIWTNKYMVNKTWKGFEHKDIELIEVASTDNTLTVNAIKGNCIVYSEEYVLNRDFNIADGKIVRGLEISFKFSLIKMSDRT